MSAFVRCGCAGRLTDRIFALVFVRACVNVEVPASAAVRHECSCRVTRSSSASGLMQYQGSGAGVMLARVADIRALRMGAC